MTSMITVICFPRFHFGRFPVFLFALSLFSPFAISPFSRSQLRCFPFCIFPVFPLALSLFSHSHFPCFTAYNPLFNIPNLLVCAPDLPLAVSILTACTLHVFHSPFPSLAVQAFPLATSSQKNVCESKYSEKIQNAR